MESISLAGTDLRVSRVGFGCCPMGRHGWGAVNAKELCDAVDTAIDLGVNFFDTADIYGLGESEVILGKALGKRRLDCVVATKFGARRDATNRTYYDNSGAWMEQALNGSLRRLNTDVIDLYQVHYPDDRTPFPSLIENLEKQRRAGKIRYYGVSNLASDSVPAEIVPPHCVSFQMEYSLANRTHEADILATQKDTRLSFISWGSLGQGILSGRYDKTTSFPENDRRNRSVYRNFHGTTFERNLAIVSIMKDISSLTGRSLPQIALRWILDRLPDSIALAGVKCPAQIRDNAGAMDWKLSERDMLMLDRASTP